MSDINTILNACELAWRQQSVASSTISEMRSELKAHLIDAQSHGKSADVVVGDDIDRFARTWAGATADRAAPTPFREVRAERAAEAERTRTRLYISIAAMIFVTLLGLIFAPKSDYASVESWQWTFVIATFTLLIGEMLTAGFFVLPFGIGAASASALAFADVEPPGLLAVFIIVSTLGLWGLREFASKDDDDVIAVGANRYVDQTAVVTEPIAGDGTVGRVRFETESWMAVNDHNQFIPVGSVVRVSEVRGARLVVSAV